MIVSLCSARRLLVGVFLLLPGACSKKEKEPEAAPKSQGVAPASSNAVLATIDSRPYTPPPLAKCEPDAGGKCAPSALCSPDCKPLSNPECVKCEAAGDCAPFATNCENPGLSADEKKTCYDIQACVLSSHCFEGPKTTLGSCYCGDLDTKACLAAPMTGPSAPKGACHDLILRGMPNAKTQAHVLGNLVTRDKEHPAGWALSRFNCQKIGYKKTCADVCGFGPR
jgi:hypothetical protein